MYQRNSISRYIALLYFCFSLGVFVIFDAFVLDEMVNLIWTLFNLCLFFITLLPFSRKISKINETIIVKPEIIDFLLFLGLCCFFINIYITYTIVNSFIDLTMRIDEFKNAGHASTTMNSTVPRLLEWYSHLVSPLGYIFIGILFYALTSNSNTSKLKIFLYFIVTLNLPIYGMFGLSRSQLAQYLLLISMMYLSFRHMINKDILTIVKRFFIFFGGLVFSATFAISFARFSGRNATFSNEFISNPVIFSSLDYVSQHFYNSILAYNVIDINHLTNGISFTSPLLRAVGLGYLNLENQLNFEGQLGDLSRRFIGLFSTLSIDLHFIGAVFLLLCFCFISVKIFYKKTISQIGFIFMPIFITPILMQFANSWLSYLSFQLALFYSIILLVFRIKRRG